MTPESDAMKAAILEGSIEPTPATGGVKTMKAIVPDVYGRAPEDVLRVAEVTKPMIGDDEVLVRVHAASVDRGTWHIMTGLPYPMRVMGFGFRRPKAANPGRCLAGTVESVGPNVTELKAGGRVPTFVAPSFFEEDACREPIFRMSARLAYSSALPPPSENSGKPSTSPQKTPRCLSVSRRSDVSGCCAPR